MTTVLTLGLLALSQLEQASSTTITSFMEKRKKKKEKKHHQCHLNPRNYLTVDKEHLHKFTQQ